jgi:hypothetical protein
MRKAEGAVPRLQASGAERVELRRITAQIDRRAFHLRRPGGRTVVDKPTIRGACRLNVAIAYAAVPFAIVRGGETIAEK